MMMSTAAPPPTPHEDAVVGIRRALVVGMGRSGRAAARLLARVGVGVTLVDDEPDPSAAELAREEGFTLRLDTAPVALLDEEVGLVVPSPGVPEAAPVLVAAAARGIPIWSEPELAWRLLPRRLLAVTGTNGKTSTTELLTAMLQEDGRAAVACGNIGRPVSEAAVEEREDTVLVAELSSFQLRFCHRLRPEVGLLLNLAADHLDWHRDLEGYAAAKARIWRAQRRADWAVANADDPATLALLEGTRGRHATFSGVHAVSLGVGREGDELVARLPDGSVSLVGVGELGQAPHHRANTAAAATAALLYGASVGAVTHAARSFRPGRHRYELVATDERGVSFVDDSKATNPAAAASALAAAPSVVWIAGGLGKGVDLSILASSLAAVHDAVLIGRAAPELAEVCLGAGVPVHHAVSMEDAVALASRLARPGDTVLLAPACASFDQFSDYAERGERFAAAVREIAPRIGGAA